MGEWLQVLYRVRAPAHEIEGRAHAIAREQSIEMAMDAVTNPWVRAQVAGRVEEIRAEDATGGSYQVVIGLSALTVGDNPAQLLSMLFGNVSLQGDVELVDVVLPPSILAGFDGPNHGILGLRALTGVAQRALTCSALKPQGAPVGELADLCRRLAGAGIDIVKDDHGLADHDQSPAPFAALERHEHSHAVIVLGGRGRCLVGTQVVDLSPHDLVEVGPWEWHQFRAAADDHLGFVCIVNRERDRPELPTAADLDQLRQDPDSAAFLGLSGRGPR